MSNIIQASPRTAIDRRIMCAARWGRATAQGKQGRVQIQSKVMLGEVLEAAGGMSPWAAAVPEMDGMSQVPDPQQGYSVMRSGRPALEPCQLAASAHPLQSRRSHSSPRPAPTRPAALPGTA